VLVPPAPGVLSALGLAAAAPARDYSRTVMLPAATTDADGLAVAFAPLVEQAAADHRPISNPQSSSPPLSSTEQLTLIHTLDMRYVGQSHELPVDYRPGMGAAEVIAAFHAAHAARYGYARPDAAAEIVTARLAAVGPAAPFPLPRRAPGGPDPAAARLGHKPVWFGGDFHDTTLFDRDRLRPGNLLPGPSVIYQYDTTTIIPPGWSAQVDGAENLIVVPVGA